MRITCRISGIQINSELFGNATAKGLHPFFTLSIRELTKLAANLDQQTSEQSCKILFLALLAQSKVVRFDSALPLAKLPKELALQYMGLAVTLANQRYTKETEELLPHFVVSELTAADALRNWLATIDSLTKLGAAEIKESQLELQRERDWLESGQDLAERLAEELAQRERVRKAIQAAKVMRKLNLPVVFSWALESLGSILSPERIKYVERILYDYKIFPLSAVKEVKYLMLDYLPESHHSDYLRKEEILQFLNRVILEKAQLMAQLTSNAEELKFAKQQIAEIHDTYTIVRDGKEYLNGSVPIATAIRDALAATDAREVAAIEPAKVPTTEPKPQDYPNRLAYMLAMKRWKQAQGEN